MFENLLIERDGAVAVITVNRPQVLNALDRATIDELDHAIAAARSDEAVRAVVITGAGTKAFAAGADVRELTDLDAAAALGYAEHGQRVFAAIEDMGKPTVAAINGFALGGGCELALACTLRVAAENARLGQPEIDLGLVPGFAGTQRLPRLIGRGPALAMLLTGQPITAAEALRLGLVTTVVPAADVRSAALRLARELAGKAPIAVRTMLRLVHEGLDGTLSDGARREATAFAAVVAGQDGREGTRAFLEKRRPMFTGLT
jgi:enoyl-CoA hydratase